MVFMTTVLYYIMTGWLTKVRWKCVWHDTLTSLSFDRLVPPIRGFGYQMLTSKQLTHDKYSLLPNPAVPDG
jgi:hypothetical protein